MVACGSMEKVWDELKKIEAEAEKIRSDAQKNAQDITATAQQASEKLIANSQTYAQEEGQRLYAGMVEEANRRREEQLKTSQGSTEMLKARATRRMDSAVNMVVDSIVKVEKA